MKHSIITPRYRAKAIEPLVKSQWLIGIAIRVIEYSEEYAKQIGKPGEVLLELEDGTYYEVEPETVGMEVIASSQAMSHPIFVNDKVNVTVNGEAQQCIVSYDEQRCAFMLKTCNEINPYFHKYGLTQIGDVIYFNDVVNQNMRINVIPEEGEYLDERN